MTLAARACLLTLALAFPSLTRAQDVPAPEPGNVIFANGQAVEPQNPDVFPRVAVTNEERSAVVIVATDLDLHLTPADAREEAHAILTLRNASSTPLTRIPLQISSTLRWQAISSVARGNKPILFTQSPITTDADHTGYAQEAVLDHALDAGATLTISVFFSGQVPASTARLELIGTPPDRAAEADWDAIAPTSDETSTGLRGFGQVLWYPVAAPAVLLSEGNELFEAIARQRLLNASASMRLRLTVVYAGDPPNAVIFDGRIQTLEHTADDVNQVVDEAHGTASAEFPLQTIGFRTPSLFLTAQNPLRTGTAMLQVISPIEENAEPYSAAVETLAPLFSDWIAPAPSTPLLLLDHAGAPFQDGAFLAARLSPNATPEGIAPELVRGMTHAFFSAPAPASLWLDEGLPEFMSLLSLERTSGRAKAIAQLQQNALSVALAEPDLLAHPTLTGTPLVQADADVMLRLKAGAVLWQLRELLGDEIFRLCLTTYRHSLELTPGLARDPNAFEKSIEHTSGHDLSWFFADWVYRDRGLPDLTITQVNPRPMLPTAGHPGGYIVPVEVRNEGFAAAYVPVMVRSGELTATEHLLVPGRSSASTRVIFEGRPETVQVNDGSVPEQRSSVHTLAINIQTAP